MKSLLNGFVLLLLLLCCSTVDGECSEVSFSTKKLDLEGVKKVTRIAISGHISAYSVYTSISDQDFQVVRQPNGNPLVLYSTLANAPSWTHVDLLASELRIRTALNQTFDEVRSPLVILTVCDYETEITSFDDSSYTVESHQAGLVSMYENDLHIVFRTYRSGIIFFSMADQGDVLIAQIVHGVVDVIFDFGSLSPSKISAGRALDDGKWHEMRWLHQFDSVQLSIDGVLLNQTAPTGLYRKLDLHSVVHIGGRPPDDFSQGIETTFTGCIARLQLNSADLLQFAPSGHHKCNMAQPPSFTLHNGSLATLPFTFLPLAFEFRLVPMVGEFLKLVDAVNETLLLIVLDERHTFTLVNSMAKTRQASNKVILVDDGGWHSFSLRIRGSRLEVDVDGYTTMWLDGSEVKRISVRLANFHLGSMGCYRSASVDFSTVTVDGRITHGACEYVEQCLPNPCENGGACQQCSLDDYICECGEGYRGKNCHTTDLPHSCEEWAYTKGNRVKALRGKNVSIDIDGGGVMEPINVVCKIEKDDMGVEGVATILEHDLKHPLIVTGDTKAGAVRHTINYNISSGQLDKLVEGFETCSQFMRYTCRGGARLMTQGEDRSPSSWYSTRSEKHGLQWGSAPPYSRMCSCAINGSCLHNRMCNCDSGEDSTDEGLNSYAQLLPINGLFIGGTTKSSSVEVEIGHLKCRNRVSFDPITFSNRDARLQGTKAFSARTFDLNMHVKFGHEQLSVLTWHSVDDLHWFHVYVQEGKLIVEIVNGGESWQIVSDSRYDDRRWHSLYWEADSSGMTLRIDGSRKSSKQKMVLPNVYHWLVGSRTGRGRQGFAGVIRNVYMCGEELPLGQASRRDVEKGVSVGDDGYCRQDLCQNGGVCVDKYDGYVCDCAATPFGGADCTKEYGMLVPKGSTLQIPWQNPAHTATCHRIGLQTRSSNVTLLKTRALFADSTFNMTIDEDGHLNVKVYDGFFFHYDKAAVGLNISDNVMHDIEFCAARTSFNLTIDGMESIAFEGNWTFFEHFNVWTFLDKEFEGCLSRMQIGSAHPLKNPKTSRLNYSGKIRFGMCYNDAFIALEETTTTTTPTPEVHIFAISKDKQKIVTFTVVGGVSLLMAFVVLLLALVCYMRSRPEGVYKTNETGQVYSPSHSDEPLVSVPIAKFENNNDPSLNGNKANGNKEYFC